jgi:hypothetical protein
MNLQKTANIIRTSNKEKSHKLFNSGKYEFLGMTINSSFRKTPFWEYKIKV